MQDKQPKEKLEPQPLDRHRRIETQKGLQEWRRQQSEARLLGPAWSTEYKATQTKQRPRRNRQSAQHGQKNSRINRRGCKHEIESAWAGLRSRGLARSRPSQEKRAPPKAIRSEKGAWCCLQAAETLDLLTPWRMDSEDRRHRVLQVTCFAAVTKATSRARFAAALACSTR